MKFDKEKAHKIYEQETGITKAARDYCEKIGIDYEERYRHQLSRYISSLEEGVDDCKSEPITVKPLPFSAINEDGTFMNEKQTCQKYSLPYNKLKKANLITHNSKITWNMEFAYNIDDIDHFKEFKDDLIKEIKILSSKLPKVKAKSASSEGHLLVIDPADVHIGKLCEVFETGNRYNVQIAVQRVTEAIHSIINKCSGFNIDQVLFIVGNDILHTDNPKGGTTKGTQQDTDGIWYSNFLAAKELYINTIYQLSDLANVHVVYNPSNHDWQSGFYLCEVVKTFFHKFEGVTFDADLRHRKYYTYGDNLIGTTHGDAAKQNDLPLLMAEEADNWSECKHRYIYTHHVHHKNSKDHIGVTIESIRSPSGTDGWHDRNGYTGVPKAIEGFIHDKRQGQVCRITHNF